MNLLRLAHEVIALSASSENQRRVAQRRALLAHDPSGLCPVMIRLNRPYVARRAGVNLKDLYDDAETYLYFEFMSQILRFTLFHEDTPIVPEINLQLGVAWDLSLCGIPWIDVDGEEPWPGGPILANGHEAGGLPVPVDFSQVGMMPKTLRLYRDTQKILGSTMPVHFPDWLAGPTRVVQKLRGEANLFLDFYDDPEAVHKMYAYATRVRRSFEVFRRALTGTGPGPAEMYFWEFKTLANDEVNAQLISPAHYDRFIYPHDLEYCRDYQNVYYHGSGVFTPYLQLIRSLPNVALIEISNWTDIRQASHVLGERVILERSFLQTEPAFAADFSEREALMDEIVAGADGSFFYLVLNVDNPDEGVEQQARDWIRLARETTARHQRRVLT